jgi:hypothetical protein
MPTCSDSPTIEPSTPLIDWFRAGGSLGMRAVMKGSGQSIAVNRTGSKQNRMEKRPMKKYMFLVVLFSIALIAVPAHATYICNGTVTHLYVMADGTVAVTGPGGLNGVYLCKLGAASSGNGWTADSCKAAYSTLLAAKMSGQTASVYFNDNLNSCTAQQGWTTFVQAYSVAAE